MSGDIVYRHLRPILHFFRSLSFHPRQLACLLAVFLLFGQRGVLQHTLSHWSELSEVTGIAFNVAATAKPASAEHSQLAQKHATCLQYAAYATPAAALPMLVALRLVYTRCWHFPYIDSHAGAPIFPVAVCSRDPPIRL